MRDRPMCVHTLTLRLIKEKIRRNLWPYPSTLGWARRIGRVFGLTSRIDIDYIFDLANRRGRDVFFLQVGANDGLMDDPIHFQSANMDGAAFCWNRTRSFSRV